MSKLYLVFCLISLFLPYTFSAKEVDKDLLLIRYQTREQAWENFFMSWESCSHIEEFLQKVAFTRTKIMEAMYKIWDEPYIKRVLLFPIHHFKQYEMKIFSNVIACFLETFDDPFALPEENSEKKKSNRTERPNMSRRDLPALGEVEYKNLGKVFAGFLGDITADGLAGFLGVGNNDEDSSSSAAIVQSVDDWKDMKVTEDEVTVVLLGDRRFLRSFKFVIEDFQEYKMKCLKNTKKMTADEHKFCNIKSKDLDKKDLDNRNNGAAVKMFQTLLFILSVIHLTAARLEHRFWSKNRLGVQCILYISLLALTFISIYKA